MSVLRSAWVWRSHAALPARGDGIVTRRPNQSECRPTAGPWASNPDMPVRIRPLAPGRHGANGSTVPWYGTGRGSIPRGGSSPSVVSMQHARPLTAEEKVQVLPEGPAGRIPTGRGSRSRAYPVAVRIRPTGPSPRGANGRRTTLRPWGSRFESGRGDHPGVAERLTRSAQTRLNAAALRAAHMWVRIPPPGPSWRGHSRRGRRRVVSAGVRVRVPLSSPGWARRSMEGSLVCTQEMRVRLPPGPPNEAVDQRLAAGASTQLKSALSLRGLPWGWSGLITRVPMGFESPPRDHSGFVQRQDGGPTNRSRGFDSLTRYQLPWPHAREALRAWPWCKRQHGRSWPSGSRFESGRSPQLRVVG